MYAHRSALRRTLALFAALSFSACSASRADEAAPTAPSPLTALQLVLTPWPGEHALDRRIRALQTRIPSSAVPFDELERLGWSFVARARELNDPGSSRLALQASLAMDAYKLGAPAALLLRGHALHALHHFREAEQIALQLVELRGLSFDYGLLGDVSVDRGELARAIDAYQHMMDLRPDMHAYSRAAHVRYLMGDVSGAEAAMQVAARGASPRNRESFAWTWAKLAQYLVQLNASDKAEPCLQRALEVFPDSTAALKLDAQLALAHGDPQRAANSLRHALRLAPHPELYALLIEALRALGRPLDADQVRAQLMAEGERQDPRAFALFLATEGAELARAELLVRSELAEREDVYSYEALAWVQSAAGAHAAALASARRSLKAGTRDPRLYFHAGLVAERAGELADAEHWLGEARTGRALLLPSERAQLERSAL